MASAGAGVAEATAASAPMPLAAPPKCCDAAPIPADSQAYFDDVRAKLGAVLVGYGDYPMPGVTFKDVSSLLESPPHFKMLVEALTRRYRGADVTHVVSVESRGFLIGAPLALSLELPFVPVRTPRKLPGTTVTVDAHAGTFSRHQLEVHAGSIARDARVLLVDDIVGTGATTLAAVELMKKCGATVVECACVAELEALRGRAALCTRVPLFTLLPGAKGVLSPHAS